MRESVISINKFNKPEVLDKIETEYTLIVRLILLEPGIIQSHPQMGVGLVSKWRNCFEDQLSDLQLEIYNQMSKYLPDLLLNEVNVYYKGGILHISVVLSDYTMILGTSDFNSIYLVDVLE